MESRHEHVATASRTASASRPWWLKVSIRDLIWLTTIVAALTVLGLNYYQRTLPIRQTGIPEALRDFEQARTTCQRLGESPYIRIDGVDEPDPPGDHYFDPDRATYAYSTRIRLPDSLHNEFMEGFRKEVEAVIESNAEITSDGASRDGHTLEHFTYHYNTGTTSGALFVRTLGIETDRIEILLFIHEFDTR